MNGLLTSTLYSQQLRQFSALFSEFVYETAASASDLRRNGIGWSYCSSNHQRKSSSFDSSSEAHAGLVEANRNTLLPVPLVHPTKSAIFLLTVS